MLISRNQQTIYMKLFIVEIADTTLNGLTKYIRIKVTEPLIDIPYI